MSNIQNYEALTLEEKMRILGNMWSIQQDNVLSVFYELGYSRCQMDVSVNMELNEGRVIMTIIKEHYNENLRRELAKKLMIGYLKSYYASMYGRSISVEIKELD